MMERIDKLIASQGKFSRSEVKKLIKEGRVTAEGKTVKSPDEKYDGENASVQIDGKDIFYKKYIYIMLNKPKGVISATEDRNQKTVLDLVPKELMRKGLFPAGRLDGDTVGFILLTDDGDFAHRILSPKNHIDKTYIAEIDHPLSEEDIEKFQKGLVLGDGTVLLSAKVKMLERENPTAEVVIHEGKYHQVKRMFASLDNKVLELKRIKMGGLFLDENLKEGECREISEEELRLITKK